MEVDKSDYERLSSRSSEELTLEDVSDVHTYDDDAKLPDNHLRMSILALLCCFPCGIIAVCHSMKVNRLFSKGKVEEALKASEKAELCSVRAFTCMLLFLLCQLLLFLTGIILLICFAFDCIKTSCHW